MTLKVIKFSSTWCGPCKVARRFWDELLQAYSNKTESNIVFEDYDVDENPDLAIKYEIRSIPAFVFELDGNVVETLLGVRKADELEATINKYI